MAERQKKLDWMKKEMEENEKTISILEQAFADTDDRFEEMRITKRLQELLHNMEMADNFKRNRAARVIQVLLKHSNPSAFTLIYVVLTKRTYGVDTGSEN